MEDLKPISYFTTPELERLEVIDDITDELKWVRTKVRNYCTKEQYETIEGHLVTASLHIKTIEDEAREISEQTDRTIQYKKFIEDTRHRDVTKPVWSGYGCDAYVRIIPPYDRYEYNVEGHGRRRDGMVTGFMHDFESIYEEEAKILYERRED